MKRILIVLFTILFIGCEEESQPSVYNLSFNSKVYKLSVNSNPTEGGTISPTSGEYEEGTEVILEVKINSHYEFDKWSGDWSGSEVPLTITMDGDKKLVGNFKLMDSDGDGVTNDVDLCNSTPNGENVDEDGCSYSEYINIPDIVFADALTRLGYPVDIEGKMKPSDALKIENLIITSKINFYGQSDSNGTAIFDNSHVPDGNTKVAYTPQGEYITNTSGLEFFRNLKTMRLEFQQFDEIDLSTLNRLNLLSLWGNPIIAIDLSHNTELIHLGLSETALTSIDLSKLNNLEEVACQQGGEVPYTLTNGNKTFTVNGFSSLDFTQNFNLQRIYIHYNPMTEIGIGDNNKEKLKEIWATGTDLESLNLSGFAEVDYIILSSSNNLNYLNLVGVNNGQVPYRLYCVGCPNLSEIQVSNVTRYENALGNNGFFVDSHINFVEGQ